MIDRALIDRALTVMQFAQWLEKEHPDIYEVLYAQALNSQRSSLGALGDDGDGLTDITFDSGDVTVDSEVSPAVSIDTSATDGGFGSGLLSAASSIGSWLVSPQGLNSIAAVGTTVLRVQEAQQIADMKMAVINSNAARAAAGKPVVPITYAQNDQGQTVPVYDGSTLQMMPPELEAAIQQGRAHPVTLADGSTGYAIDNPTLSSLLGVSIPWYAWVFGAGILLLALR